MQQRQSNSNVRVRTKVGIKEPKKHKVLIFNDDETPFDFVLVVLKVVFFIDLDTARQIANDAMENDKAVVGEYTIDIARSKVAKATQMATAFGFPLKFEIEKDEDK